MFLRSQLVSRFPVSLLRLGGNSAPMTSSFSTTNAAVSRCNNHVIVSSTPQLARHFGTSSVWLRSRNGKDWKDVERFEQSGGKNSDSFDKRMQDTKTILKMIAVCTFSLFLCVTTLYRLHNLPNEVIPTDATQVDFATFTEKYLKTGEVQKIVIVPLLQKVLVTLHKGAIIDRMQAKSRHVVFDFSGQPNDVINPVRAVEAEMGISSFEQVEVEITNPMGLQLLIFFGCVIVGFVYMGCTLRKLGPKKSVVNALK